MIDPAADLEQAASATARETIRVPANLMKLLRQSYDTREKVLDWCLAVGVVAALAYTFRDRITVLINPPPVDANAGRDDEPVPNQNVWDAFKPGGINPGLYTYNMPKSRIIRYATIPSGVAIPSDPAGMPAYPIP